MHITNFGSNNHPISNKYWLNLLSFIGIEENYSLYYYAKTASIRWIILKAVKQMFKQDRANNGNDGGGNGSSFFYCFL